MLIIGPFAGITVIVGQVGEDLQEQGRQGAKNKHSPSKPVISIAQETTQSGGR